MTKRAVTFSRAVDEFLLDGVAEHNYRPATVKSYRDVLRWTMDILGTEIDPRTITEDDVRHVLRTWIANNPGLSSGSRANRISVLKSYFRWQRRRYKVEDPMLDIDRPRKQRGPVRTVTPREYELLLKECATYDPDARVMRMKENAEILIRVLAWSGIRRSEFMALTWDDIDFHENLIVVKDGKGGKSRVVFVDQKLISFLETRRGEPNERLVTWTDKGSPGKALTRLAELAGIRYPLGNHAFRRMFATRWVEANPDQLFALQEQMGHAQLDTTRLYAPKVSPRRLREAVKRASEEPELMDALHDAMQTKKEEA